MKRILKKIAIVAVFIVVFIGVSLMALPAWVLSQMTQDMKVSIVNTSGSIWSGEGQLAWHQPDGSLIALPGSIHWRVSVGALLVGNIRADIQHQIFKQPLQLSGRWSLLSAPELTIEQSTATLPAQWLVFLGAPFNTLQPEGQLTAKWENITVGGATRGKVVLQWQQAVVKMSPIRPLGSYEFVVDLNQHEWRLNTLEGVLKLEGASRLGRPSVIKATPTQEVFEKMRNMMNLLGPRRGNYYEIKAG